MKNHFFIISLFLLTTQLAFAGGMDSGGGQGYVCFNSKIVASHAKDNNGNLDEEDVKHISQLVTLDLYEAKLKRGNPAREIKIVERNPDENYEQYLDRIISRIGVRFPELAEQIFQMSEEFSGDHILWSPIGLTEVSDGNSVLAYDTDYCTLTTLAIQFREEDAQYLNLDPRLFNHDKMSEESKAVLILHEYLYAIARMNGRSSSRGTRMAISYLIRDDLSPIEVAESLKLLKFL